MAKFGDKLPVDAKEVLAKPPSEEIVVTRWFINMLTKEQVNDPMFTRLYTVIIMAAQDDYRRKRAEAERLGALEAFLQRHPFHELYGVYMQIKRDQAYDDEVGDTA